MILLRIRHFFPQVLHLGLIAACVGHNYAEVAMSCHPVQVLTLQFKFSQGSVKRLRHRFSFRLRDREANFLTFDRKKIKGFRIQAVEFLPVV